MRELLHETGLCGRGAGKRRDVQGLRAIAVLVVVMDHLIHWPRGGFVGVDIFFVISGYLITDLMLREHERTGRVSYLGFYRRRARRILPVSMVVLLATVATSYLLYRPVRVRMIGADALWSLGFMANWHFAAAKTDYFNNEGLTSPLQHYWSLAVEEQFYVLWPVIVLVAASIGAGRVGPRRALAAVLSFGIVASLWYALSASVSEPTGAYFSTGARAWELGVGALLAVGSGRHKALATRVQPVLSLVGLAGILLSLFVISDTSTFPAPWALLPVLSTALVIAAGCSGSEQALAPLTNPVSQYLGNVSYSMYLWHFPVIILGTAYAPEGGLLGDVWMLSLLGFLTVASFHLVEDPIRRSAWLEPRVPGRRRARVRDSFDAALWRRAGYGVLLAAMVSTAAFGLRPAEVSDVPVFAFPDPGAGAQPVSGPHTLAQRLIAEIDAASLADEIPELRPSIDSLLKNKAPQWAANGCGTTGSWNASRCTYGSPSGTKRVAVIGDSIAISWLPGIIKGANAAGFSVHSFVAGHCPAASVRVGDGSDGAQCARHRQWAMGAIRQLRPDVIVMSDASFLMTTLTDKSTGAAAVAEWTQGATTTLKSLTEVAPTVVLQSPPGSKNLLDCATLRAKPSACAGSVTGPGVKDLERAEVTAAGRTGARYIPVTQWFCGAAGQCPSFMGQTPVYVDGIHLTRQFSERLAPVLLASILEHEPAPAPSSARPTPSPAS